MDTIGTLVGTASRAGMTDKDGNMPNMKEALTSDAIGTVAGACCGTSTVTTFVESASGVEAGGRTGLTALTTAVMFLACIFIAPIAAIIPAAATSSALIYVGILMLQGLKNGLQRSDQIVPVFIMLIAMPISGLYRPRYRSGHDLLHHHQVCLLLARPRRVRPGPGVIAALFIVKFFAVGKASYPHLGGNTPYGLLSADGSGCTGGTRSRHQRRRDLSVEDTIRRILRAYGIECEVCHPQLLDHQL